MRKYNWHPSIPDHRDLFFKPSGVPLPTKVDLRHRCSPVVDQGQIGSCTGNALAGAVEFLRIVEKFQASRLFIYFNERAMEGTVNQDAGANIRDGVKSLNKLGVCSEKDWAYKRSQLFKKPSVISYKDALQRKISSYQRATGLDHSRAALADGFPVVFGFTVYESFESAAVAKDGMMPMPVRGEQVLGGHAVLAVGYDDSMQRLIVRNSWGTGWGDKGYFYMPYAYIESAKLASDFWTIQK